METIKDRNSIILIRLFAAIQVFIGHASEHLSVVFLPGFISKGFELFQGVPIFFILSGFLIWKSIEFTKDFPTYCKKRVLRLYPELWGGGISKFCSYYFVV